MSTEIAIADRMFAAIKAGDRAERERLSAIMRGAWLAEAGLTHRDRVDRVKVLRQYAKDWPFPRATQEPPLELERRFFDHAEVFKSDAGGHVIVCHLYDCDRLKCEEFADAIGVEVEFPPALSWWFAGRTTLVVWRLPPPPPKGRRKRMRAWLRTRSMFHLMGMFRPRIWVECGRFDSNELGPAALADLHERFLRWELAQLKREGNGFMASQ